MSDGGASGSKRKKPVPVIDLTDPDPVPVIDLTDPDPVSVIDLVSDSEDGDDEPQAAGSSQKRRKRNDLYPVEPPVEGKRESVQPDRYKPEGWNIPFSPDGATTKIDSKKVLAIRESPGKGDGVFAIGELPIACNATQFPGKRISKKVADGLSTEAKEFTIALTVDCESYLAAHKEPRDNLERCGHMLNHSKNPNCQLKQTGGHIIVVTARKVQKGEELTVRYPKSYLLMHMPNHV
jgi:hypothetical protein